MPVKAADIMTRKVITVQPGAPVMQVARTLSEHDISAVPVCDEHGTVIGIVSEGDLMHPFSQERMLKRSWWLDLLAEGTDLAPEFVDYIRTDRRCARDLMTQPVISASEDTAIPELADLMTRHHVKRLPILADGKLVGVVSRSDVVRALADSSVEHVSAA